MSYSFQCACDLQVIEEKLHAIVEGERLVTGPNVLECMNHALFGGGKRIRPLLGLVVARTFQPGAVRCLPYLAAVEFLHTASLILDDLPCMDNGYWRRSRPAAHVCYGESTAILTAFGLVVLSVRLAQGELAGGRRSREDSFLVELLECLGRSGLIYGQEIDLTRKCPGQAPYLKTAPLFELACAAGLQHAQVPKDVRCRLLAFGRQFGVAYQAMDDFVDHGEAYESNAVRELAACTDQLNRLQEDNPKLHQLEKFVNWLKSVHLSPSHTSIARGA